jgi:hypothetical protein
MHTRYNHRVASDIWGDRTLIRSLAHTTYTKKGFLFGVSPVVFHKGQQLLKKLATFPAYISISPQMYPLVGMRVNFSVKDHPHSLHRKCFSLECDCCCLCNLDFQQKLRPYSLHTKGFFPKSILWGLKNDEFMLTLFPYSHTQKASPVRRSDFWLKLLLIPYPSEHSIPHSEHSTPSSTLLHWGLPSWPG